MTRFHVGGVEKLHLAFQKAKRPSAGVRAGAALKNSMCMFE